MINKILLVVILFGSLLPITESTNISDSMFLISNDMLGRQFDEFLMKFDLMINEKIDILRNDLTRKIDILRNDVNELTEKMDILSNKVNNEFHELNRKLDDLSKYMKTTINMMIYFVCFISYAVDYIISRNDVATLQ